MSERLDRSQVLTGENTAGHPTVLIIMSTKSTNEHKPLLEDKDETITQCSLEKKVAKRPQPKNKVDEVEWIIVRDDQEDEEVTTYCLLDKSPNAFQHTPDGPPRYLTADQFAFTGLLAVLGRDQESMSRMEYLMVLPCSHAYKISTASSWRASMIHLMDSIKAGLGMQHLSPIRIGPASALGLPSKADVTMTDNGTNGSRDSPSDADT